MRRIWSWLFAKQTLWCTYRHHWAPMLLVGSRPRHYTHYWCHDCFNLWLHDDPLYWGTRIQHNERASLLRWKIG
jgi:hypothetical protein